MIIEKEKYIGKDGLVLHHVPSATTYRFNRQETCTFMNKKINFNKLDHFPEIIHLSISNRCDMLPLCKYCYIDKNAKEISTRNWKKIIKEIADIGVFGVTLAGAEPFMRKDVCILGKYANNLHLNPTLTTNGMKITNYSKDELACFKLISVSWHKHTKIFENALSYLKKLKIPRTINYIYDKRHKDDLEYIKRCALDYDASILFLAYKHVIGDFENQIHPKKVLKVAIETSKEGYKCAVDSPCLDQCWASKRFCTISSSGNLQPCSFVENKRELNVLNLSLKGAWKLRDKIVFCPYYNGEQKW